MDEKEALIKIVGSKSVLVNQRRLDEYSRAESFIRPIKLTYVVKP